LRTSTLLPVLAVVLAVGVTWRLQS
jgi:hypothetical protein